MAKSSIAAVICAFAVAGCATQQQIDDVKKLDYGQPPGDAIWQASAQMHFQRMLKDPESARYRWGCPVRGYVRHAALAMRSGMEFVGFIARVDVNAKNSFGGYTGFKPYIVAIGTKGDVVYSYESQGWSVWDHPRVYALDNPACVNPR